MSLEVFGPRFTSWFLFLLLLASRVFTGEPPEVRVGFQAPSEPPPPYQEAQSTPPSPPEASTVTGGQLLQEALREIAGAKPAPQMPKQTSPPPAIGAATMPFSSVESSQEQSPAFTTQEAAQPAGERPIPEAGPVASWQGPSSVRIVVSLVAVLGVVAAVLYGLRRLQHSRPAFGGSAGLLQVLARTHLEPGRSILLVKAPGRVLIVGSSREGLIRLAEITDKREVEEILRSAGQGKRSDAFAELLKSQVCNDTGEETA